MELTSEQRKIIELVTQLPDDLKENTLEILSQMHTSTNATKKDLKDVMLSPDVTIKKNESLEKYKATEKIINEFHQFCLSLSEKESLDFWDRIAFSTESIVQLVQPLLKIWGKEVLSDEKFSITINALKSDWVKIYVTKHFLRDISEFKTLDQFKDSLSKEIPQKIKEFNESAVGSKIGINTVTIDAHSEQLSISDFNKHLIAAFDKIDKFEKNKEFVDKMWDNFVKDFLQDSSKIKSDEDKALFFEQLFNIAYNAADYIDFIKNERNIIYCFNYQFLHNNFDSSKTDHYHFQVNHIDKSTTYSNLVYKWANELGIKKLKVLVGKYLIKP